MLHSFISMLYLFLIPTLIQAVSHEDLRQSFRASEFAQRLPSEIVKDDVLGYFDDLVYGDNPISPVVSLQETEILFPNLSLAQVHMYQDTETLFSNLISTQVDIYEVTYSSAQDDPFEYLLPQDRYLTVHIVNQDQDEDPDTVEFFFENDGGINCTDIQQYIQQTNGGIRRMDSRSNPNFISKDSLNENFDTGTAILLHIPKGCLPRIASAHRTFVMNYHVRKNNIPLPETLPLLTGTVPECLQQRNVPFSFRKYFLDLIFPWGLYLFGVDEYY